MNTLEKALDQLKNCSRIIACKNYNEVKSLFALLYNQGYKWIDETSLNEIDIERYDSNRASYIAIYDDSKVIDDFMELSVLMMNDEDKNLFLDKIITYKKCTDNRQK